MKNLKKKGFTIVELVIVIAVIAVLAAVLIPTFVNLTKKANLSADQQAVRQMNVVLATEDLETFEDTLAALDKAGYNALDTLIPVSTGYKFYWAEEAKSIILVNENNEVVFPTNLTDFDLGKALSENKAFNLKKGAASTNISSASGLDEALEKGQNVELSVDYDLAATTPINDDVTIDLKGNDLDASANGGRPFELYNGATLTINAEGSVIDCGEYGLVNIVSNANVNVIINGGTIKANTDNGAFIKVRPGEGTVNITLNNVNYVDESNDGFIVNRNGFSGTMNLTINGGSYKAFAGIQTINANVKDATIETKSFGFEITGQGTISNCTIKVGSNMVDTAPSAAVAVSNGGSATVTGCTITCAGTETVFAVYSGNGTITQSNNTVNGTYTNLEKKHQ